MAANIPTALRSADITRFAIRAQQVEKAKPVIAYWCNYWIVNQILSKELHNSDDESMTYTMTLMDRLEQTKAEHENDDAVMDDVAGQAYCEQFGSETFQRAENTMKANKVSRQTADTFQAAATFLDLSHIWGPLDPEIASKIKYSKFHALRIAKALKAGEDPNLSNPAPEPEPNQEEPELDPNDPEVRALSGDDTADQNQLGPRQPSVEEVPDEHDRLQRHLAQRSILDQSLHPSRAPSIPRQPERAVSPLQDVNGEQYYHGAANGEVSPLGPSSPPRELSEGGGYFPRVPGEDDDTRNSGLPDTPANQPWNAHSADMPSAAPLRQSPQDSTSQPPPELNRTTHDQSSQPLHINQADIPQAQLPLQQGPHLSQPSIPSYPRQAPQRPPQTIPPSTASSRAPIQYSDSQGSSNQQNNTVDEEAIMKAQKHARWAISALNFEDVNTAVKELRGALQTLGAS
ncbi:hypothetical protein MMC09_000060 [Bachmanniomyces sp. S44760]|nr:hypothetical protein [Bachmanniomyces sp. S44760]